MIRDHATVSCFGGGNTVIKSTSRPHSLKLLRYEAINPELRITGFNNRLHIMQFGPTPPPSEPPAPSDRTPSDGIPEPPELDLTSPPSLQRSSPPTPQIHEFKIPCGDYSLTRLAEKLTSLLNEFPITVSIANHQFQFESKGEVEIEIVAGTETLDTIATGGQTITRTIGIFRDLSISPQERVSAPRFPRNVYSINLAEDETCVRQYNRMYPFLKTWREELGKMLFIQVTTDRQANRPPDTIEIRAGAPGFPAKGYCSSEIYLPARSTRIICAVQDGIGRSIHWPVLLQFGLIHRGGPRQKKKNH